MKPESVQTSSVNASEPSEDQKPAGASAKKFSNILKKKSEDEKLRLESLNENGATEKMIPYMKGHPNYSRPQADLESKASGAAQKNAGTALNKTLEKIAEGVSVRISRLDATGAKFDYSDRILGKIKVNLHMENGRLKLTVNPAESRTTELIKNKSQKLCEMLLTNSIPLEDLKIDTESDQDRSDEGETADAE
jgi:hypothetical protein